MSTQKEFKIKWPTGNIEYLCGDNIEEALEKAGYNPSDALCVMEYWTEVNFISHICKGCKKPFFMSEKHEKWYAEKGLIVPCHCPECRKLRKLKDSEKVSVTID